jgi:hypothetical protein
LVNHPVFYEKSHQTAVLCCVVQGKRPLSTHQSRLLSTPELRTTTTSTREYIFNATETQTGWSPRSERSFERWNGSISTKTMGNLKLGVSRNRFCDFLADPDSRSFSRVTLPILARSRYQLELKERLKERKVRKTPLFAPFIYGNGLLPRQARDKHREKRKKEWRFSAG